MLYAQFELWDHISKLTQSAIEHRRRAASVNDKYFAEPVYAKAYSAIRKRKYYASASLIVIAKSRARGIRMYACCGL